MHNERRLPPGSVRRYEAPLPHRYTMADLEAESGMSARTIRFYIAEGLLQPAYGRGPSAVYDADHLLRLRFITRLKNEHVPLGEIKARLSDLTPDALAAALRIEMTPEAQLWRHFRLHDDLQIVIRDRAAGDRPVTHDQAFGLIIEYARSVLEDLDRRVDE